MKARVACAAILQSPTNNRLLRSRLCCTRSIHGTYRGSSADIVTQLPQDYFKPIVGEIKSLDGLSRHRLKGEKPVGYPGFDMHKAVVASGQNGAEPDGADSDQTESIPVAVSEKMGVHQRR
jgi:hypothetical protein